MNGELSKAVFAENEDFSFSTDQRVNNHALLLFRAASLWLSHFCNDFGMVFKRKPASMNESVCDLLMVRTGAFI